MIKFLIVLSILFTGPAMAEWPNRAKREPDPPLPISCEEIRRHIAIHGRAKSLAWAWENMSFKQINQARRECKV